MSRVLLWDFDGTLGTRTGGWSGTLCELLAEACPDRDVDRDAVRPHMTSGFPWQSPEVVREPCSPEAWWDGLLPLFTHVITALTGLEEAEARSLAGEVRSTYLRRERWTLFEDTTPTLRALAERGWRHVILSNHVPELETIVSHLGLEALVECCYSSAVTGCEKPNPAAFERVFADLPEARGGWMIGDNWRADVEGASTVGMRAILVRTQDPRARLACQDLAGVIGIVGE